MSEQLISRRHVYQGRVVDLRLDEVRLPNGRTVTREIVEHRGAVALLALDDEGRILMVRQYRAPVDRDLLELPAGTLEADEEPEACARRELAEETGFVPGRLERLVGFYTAPGFCTEYLHVFLATDLRPESGTADEDESIEVEAVPLDRALGLIGTGEIADAKTLVGLLAYAARRTG